jgi:hypothetical protein
MVFIKLVPHSDEETNAKARENREKGGAVNGTMGLGKKTGANSEPDWTGGKC